MSKIQIKLVAIAAISMLWLGSMTVHAQSSCDKLYSEGVSQQQIMTIPAQKKAIVAFEKAKACYDAKKNKDLCDKQIRVCRNTISLLGKKATNVDSKKKETDTQMEDSVAVDSEGTKREMKEIVLSISKVYIKFKGKGGEFQKVKVDCNDDNWKITDCPSWVRYSVSSDKEIVIEVEKNPSNKEERSGTLTVKCEDKTASLIIVQEKFKRFGVI